MKINNGYQDPRASSAQDAAKVQESAAAQGRTATGTARSGAPGAADEVNLSSLASALQGALSDSPERAAYLEALAADYAAGTYKPDAKGTAQGIIREALRDSADPQKGE